MCNCLCNSLQSVKAATASWWLTRSVSCSLSHNLTGSMEFFGFAASIVRAAVCLDPCLDMHYLCHGGRKEVTAEQANRMQEAGPLC